MYSLLTFHLAVGREWVENFRRTRERAQTDDDARFPEVDELANQRNTIA